MRTTLALMAALAAAPLTAQQTPPEGVVDWRMPFRSPQANLVPPETTWPHLRPMYELARAAAPDLKHFEGGVEVVDDPVWIKHREALARITQDAGYMSSVLIDSRHVADRAIAFYGAFYLPDPALVFALIEHIPGEPARALREDAYVRAVEFMRVYLPARVAGDVEEWKRARVGPGGRMPPRPGDFAYGFDPAPFVALLSVEDWRDHEQALWFLARCAELQPALGLAALERGKTRLRELVLGANEKVRAAAGDFLSALDPVEDRETPADDAGAEAWLAYYDAVLYEVFPPIRRISQGLYELHPHQDRDDLVRVARAGLEDGSLGTANANGTTKAGAPFRGFRIEQLPAPLDRLGLEVGAVITAINGMPTPTADRLFRAVDRALPQQREFAVEFVDRLGQTRAIRYRIR